MPLRCRSAMARTCGTVKLTVIVLVIPSAMHSSSTSRPDNAPGSLTAMLGAHWWKRLAIASIASRSPVRDGFTCAHTYPVAPPVRWYSGSSIAAHRVTTIFISASAFCSAGSPCAITASISGSPLGRLLARATADKYGLQVTPPAPRSRANSPTSAESCHQLVFVFLMTQFKYVLSFMIDVSSELPRLHVQFFVRVRDALVVQVVFQFHLFRQAQPRRLRQRLLRRILAHQIQHVRQLPARYRAHRVVERRPVLRRVYRYLQRVPRDHLQREDHVRVLLP